MGRAETRYATHIRYNPLEPSVAEVIVGEVRPYINQLVNRVNQVKILSRDGFKPLATIWQWIYTIYEYKRPSSEIPNTVLSRILAIYFDHVQKYK
jgi:hypothetical protein